MNKKKDDMDSDISSEEDNSTTMNTRKRKITAHGKKNKNNSATEGVKRQKVITPISESSESDPDMNSPSQEIQFSNHPVIEKIPSNGSVTTQQSCSCATYQDEINSLKNHINSTIEKHSQLLSIQMSQLGRQLVDVQLALKQLEKRATVNCDVNSDFENNWKLLPCNTKQEFENFDERIKTDLNFRQKLAKKFINLINKRTTIVRNTGEILRSCLTRELALKFNPVKPSEGKLFTFVNTNLYNIIKASLLSTFSSAENPLSESDIIKGLSTVLHHCRDWEGGRLKRQKQIPQTHEETTITIHRDCL